MEAMRALLLAALVSFIGGASFLLVSRPISAEDDPRVREYTEAIGYNPHLPEAYLHRGLAWAKLGEHDRAIVDYNRALALNPALRTAYITRGMAWERKHDFQSAIADYSAAARLSSARGARRYERRIAELRARG
jgi:tetratricopeptide (TPR) repeat protein